MILSVISGMLPMVGIYSDVLDGAGNISTRKNSLPNNARMKGKLVVAEMTAVELGDTNGHVAVVISAPLMHSNPNSEDYPRVGYWAAWRYRWGKSILWLILLIWRC
jgi:hypothetical protein